MRNWLLNIATLLLIAAAAQAQVVDSTKVGGDSIRVSVAAEKSALEARIDYQSRDSIKFNVKNQIVELFGAAMVDYGTIHLEAGYIRIDFSKFMIYAYGLPDSNGVVQGKPLFTDGDQQFESDTIAYNYESKKGIIQHIFSEQGGGFLHGDRVKKMPDNTILVRDGSFTTCSLHDPHFQIVFGKAKVIPNDKIITGPVYLEIEGIPTPLVLPFGFFPNKKGRASGILIPSYGESTNRGFFLQNGGYYFGLSDKIDLAVRGDIYSRGSWALKTQANYKVRYRYEGVLNVSYAVNVFGERNTSGYEKQKDFFIKWQHTQDSKARPHSRFSASVNAGTANYNSFNTSSVNDILSSNYSSSISYSTSFLNIFNFTANFNHNQNKQTHVFSLTLPEISLSTSRIYPFRRSGKKRTFIKALDNLTVSYVMNTRNSFNTIDSLLFDEFAWQNFDNGIKHSIPVSLPFKLWKVVTLTNTFTYNERWYSKTIEKHWNNSLDSVITDTIPGFSAARDFAMSSAFSTKLYTYLTFKRGPVSAFRHVLTPSVTFVFRPDFADQRWGYYQYYLTPGSLTPTRYSVFENAIYGGPPSGKASMMTFALGNNLEMKVRNRKDSITGMKKVVLIDNFTIAASYNAAADSLNWSKVSMSGRTKLFKNLDLRYAALFDPYVVDTSGSNLNQFEWDLNHRLLRQNTGEWGASLNYMLNQATFTKKKSALPDSLKPKSYGINWNLNFSYTLQYRRDYTVNAYEPEKFIQTLSFGGEVNFTPHWKVSVMSGYDFVNHDFSYTSLNIHRDLHCWEIVFNWIPTGFYKSYNFTIRVKSTILQDLKLEKKTDWRDYY